MRHIADHPIYGPLIVGVSLAVYWAAILTENQRQKVSALVIALLVYNSLVNIVALIDAARSGETRRRRLALLLVFTIGVLLANFTYIYWAGGGGHNFTHRLSHLDAVYFAVGTLSSAGTGNIAALSQSARAIQTVQMMLDIGLVLFAASAVVTRLMAPHPAKAARPGSGKVPTQAERRASKDLPGQDDQ